jgi:hypothetical protein
MSEGVAHGAHAPAPSRTQPLYGEGRLSYMEPPKSKEHLDRRHEIALAMTIFAPVFAGYCAIAFGLYRAVGALI